MDSEITKVSLIAVVLAVPAQGRSALPHTLSAADLIGLRRYHAMAEVQKGRFTADVGSLGDDVIVFLIGMRIKQALESPRMVASLRRDAKDAEIPCPTP